MKNNAFEHNESEIEWIPFYKWHFQTRSWWLHQKFLLYKNVQKRIYHNTYKQLKWVKKRQEIMTVISVNSQQMVWI